MQQPDTSSRFLDSYLGLIRLSVGGAIVLPFVARFASRLHEPRPVGWAVIASAVLVVFGGAAVVVALRHLQRRYAPWLDTLARRQSQFLAELPPAWILPSIGAAAALGLFLELAMIRWQASMFELFAFYKNLGLLSCFAGLGLGYALADRGRIPLVLTSPLLCIQFLLLTVTRHGIGERRYASLLTSPVHEPVSMGIHAAESARDHAAIYFLLLVVFFLTALSFLPLGQLCGALMERAEKLRGYAVNLMGSLAGVIGMLALSAFWTPPAVWFAVAFAGILVFQAFDRRALIAAALAALSATVVLTWPVALGWQQVHSPYQLVEIGRGNKGLFRLRAAGHYYQSIFDLSAASQATDETLRRNATYYELPYRVHGHAEQVAVVGAGMGNDVAAALRSGARRVDAVEIDPAILFFGRAYHPEKPYADARVHAVVDDARSFLRKTHQTYDLIAYGLLDSHVLATHASSVRLDSFVYTVEAFREARSRLREGGLLSLSFAVMSPEIGRKMYRMLEQAFDGQQPTCIRGHYDGAVVFLQGRDGTPHVPWGTIAAAGFADTTATYANPALAGDPSTDDWPFLYMPRRVYPYSYAFLLALIAGASLFLASRLFDSDVRTAHPSFFLLGAGFMLVETKSITELALGFGTTWHVIGAVISGVLLMAFLANWVVRTTGIRNLTAAYILLFASLVLGIAISAGGGFSATLAGRVSSATVLTLPLFFSGIVFSVLLRGSGNVSAALGLNLLGAMCGGLLEYNSMYFGFRFLYWLAIAIYAAAAASGWLAPVRTIVVSDGSVAAAHR
jgi:spermidine synthase